jgi:hypothetical protein
MLRVGHRETVLHLVAMAFFIRREPHSEPSMLKLFTLCRAASLLLLASLQIAHVSAQRAQAPIWEAVPETNIAARGHRQIQPEKYRTFRLNQSELANVLRAAPLESSAASKTTMVVLTVPTPDGRMVRFRVEESPILAPAIAAQVPTWKTYQGYGIDDPAATARFDWTDRGFHGYVLDPAGTFSIDPYQAHDIDNYIVFRKNEFGRRARDFHCQLDELLSQGRAPVGPAVFLPQFTHGSQLRTYRLAVATTFEYTQFFRQPGDTNLQAQTRALNQVVISVNRIVAVYRKEVSVSFTLVSGTNLIYVTNPETPADYANNGGSADLNANQTNVNSVIGSANYDVGHLFQTGDGGIASLGSVCGTSKARGLSGLPNPTGDPFDVDYVAHELGHQFNANHTFNATGNCGTSPFAARKEPGSAVTIMGYAGICSNVANLQLNSIDTFHVHNLTEMITFLTTGAGANCGTLSGTNAVPVITPLSNYTIPTNTPFVLTANATDMDDDPLTYSWEQNNASASTSSYSDPLNLANVDDDDVSLANRPGFRSYLPTSSPSRMFPSLPYVLNNSNEPPLTYTGISATGSICGPGNTCITGEDLPSAARTMNFRVSVRDGKGGVSDAGTVLTVVNTGTPFKVTSQNVSPTPWQEGESRLVTWDVSGTTANGINVANVKISLSTDGGQTFPIVLAASTANDGAESIIVPAANTSRARLKVEAIGNIFFDISDADFTITPAAPFALTSVVSRKVHGAAGTFDLPISVSGIPTTEPRIGQGGAHTVVFTFNRPLASADVSITGGAGTLNGPPVISGSTVTVELSGVVDMQVLELSLDATDTSGEPLFGMSVQIGFLIGDSTGDRSVSSGDISHTKSLSGQTATSSNFRADFNVSGSINATDVTIAKTRSGSQLPSSTTAKSR